MAGGGEFHEPEFTGVPSEIGKMGLRRANGGGEGEIEGWESFTSSRRSFRASWWSGGVSGEVWPRWRRWSAEVGLRRAYIAAAMGR